MQNLKQNFKFWRIKYSPIELRPHRWENEVFRLFYCCWRWRSLGLLCSTCSCLQMLCKSEGLVRAFTVKQCFLMVHCSNSVSLGFHHWSGHVDLTSKVKKGDLWSLQWHRLLKLLSSPSTKQNCRSETQTHQVEMCRQKELWHDYTPLRWIIFQRKPQFLSKLYQQVSPWIKDTAPSHSKALRENIGNEQFHTCKIIDLIVYDTRHKILQGLCGQHKPSVDM